MLTDIIIPTFNNESYTIKCIQSIKQYTSNYRIIWVDNGSTEESKAKVRESLNGANFFAIENTENLGFVKATNQGIATSTAPYIVLLNNDTEVEAGWLDKMIAITELNKRIGLVGPTTVIANSWQNREKLKAQGWNLEEEFKIIHSMLAFFCVLIKREVIVKVGYLSEEYGGGFADDDDYCERVKQAGYSLALAISVTIPHYHRTTFKAVYGDKYVNMQHENLRIFKEKWNK